MIPTFSSEIGGLRYSVFPLPFPYPNRDILSSPGQILTTLNSATIEKDY